MGNSPTTLSYSTLPPGARLQVVENDGAVTFIDRPRNPLGREAAGIAGFALLLIFLVLLTNHQLIMVRRSNGFRAFLSLGLLIFTLASSVVLLVQRVRRGHQQELLAIHPDRLVLLIPGDKEPVERQIPLRDVKRARVQVQGTGLNLRTLGQLRIDTASSPFTLFRGYDVRELQLVLVRIQGAMASAPGSGAKRPADDRGMPSEQR